MTGFHDVRFPLSIAFASTGGPERKTEIVTLGSGYEERNAVWAASRRRYDVGYGIKSLDDIHTVLAFYEARLGRLYGFRFRDFADYKSCPPLQTVSATDQVLGNGDGVTKQFPLKKCYSSGAFCWVRTITKPEAGSISVAIDNTVQNTGWQADADRGLVTFDTAPQAGAVITAGYVFDVPVRFDSDTLSVNYAGFSSGEVPTIPLVEIRL